MKNGRLKNLIMLVLVLWMIPVHAHDIHVALHGSDSNAGTASEPLFSIAAAQKALRNSGKLGKESCRIIIHKGTYRLTTPLRITTKDGGSEEFPVIYTAAENEEVTLTGAQRSTSKWELFKDGIYRTNMGKMDAIDQIFIDVKSQH